MRSRCSGKKEPRERRLLGHPRITRVARTRNRALRRQHRVRRGARRGRSRARPRRRLGDPPPRDVAASGDQARRPVCSRTSTWTTSSGSASSTRSTAPDLDVHIWGPASTTLDLSERLARYLSPPLFPVRMRDLDCRLTLHDVPLGTFELGDFVVRSALVSHPGPTVGYRDRARARHRHVPDGSRTGPRRHRISPGRPSGRRASTSRTAPTC